MVPVLPDVVIRRCQRIVVGEEGIPALWSQPPVHCHARHKGTTQVVRTMPNLNDCVFFFGKIYQHIQIKIKQSFTCILEGNRQHLRIWRLLNSTQNVWIKTSRYKCHINFELCLQPVLHHVSRLQESDKCTAQVIFHYRQVGSQCWDCSVLNEIFKYPPLSSTIIRESDIVVTVESWKKFNSVNLLCGSALPRG